MTKRQANLIIGLLCAAIALLVMFGAATLRGQDLTRNEIARAFTEAAVARQEAEAARKQGEATEGSLMDVLEMQKRAAGIPALR